MLHVSSLPVTTKVTAGNDTKSLRLRFVTKRLAFGQVLVRLLPFFRTRTNSPVLHTHLQLRVAFT